jgi:hypothetical protein
VGGDLVIPAFWYYVISYLAAANYGFAAYGFAAGGAETPAFNLAVAVLCTFTAIGVTVYWKARA